MKEDRIKKDFFKKKPNLNWFLTACQYVLVYLIPRGYGIVINICSYLHFFLCSCFLFFTRFYRIWIIFKKIYSIQRWDILTGTSALDQSGPRRNRSKEVLNTLYIFETGALLSDTVDCRTQDVSSLFWRNHTLLQGIQTTYFKPCWNVTRQKDIYERERERDGGKEKRKIQ